MVTEVHKSPKNAKQTNNTHNRSLTKKSFTPNNTTKDSKRGDNHEKVVEYVLSRILGHAQRLEGMFYVVYWYGYGVQLDIVDPASNIPQDFIDQCWRRKYEHR